MRLASFLTLALMVCACGEDKSDGFVENYYENGQLRSKGMFEMGQAVGEEESYYENGQLWSKSSYKEGKRHGSDEYYDIYGELRWRGSYNLGKECGEWFNDGKTETYPTCPLFE